MRYAALLLFYFGNHHASGFLLGPNVITRALRELSTEAACATNTKSHAASMKLDRVNFAKYQGLGNDFILVDNRDREDMLITANEAANLCDRWVLQEVSLFNGRQSNN